MYKYCLEYKGLIELNSDNIFSFLNILSTDMSIFNHISQLAFKKDSLPLKIICLLYKILYRDHSEKIATKNVNCNEC